MFFKSCFHYITFYKIFNLIITGYQSSLHNVTYNLYNFQQAVTTQPILLLLRQDNEGF